MGDLFYLIDKHMLERHDDPELADSVRGVLFDVRITDTGIEEVERRRTAATEVKEENSVEESKVIGSQRTFGYLRNSPLHIAHRSKI